DVDPGRGHLPAAAGQNPVFRSVAGEPAVAVEEEQVFAAALRRIRTDGAGGRRGGSGMPARAGPDAARIRSGGYGGGRTRAGCPCTVRPAGDGRGGPGGTYVRLLRTGTARPRFLRLPQLRPQARAVRPEHEAGFRQKQPALVFG